MAQRISELMSKNVVHLQASESVVEAARQMKSTDVGAVVVEEDSKVCGIVTDRDVTLRVVAEGRDPNQTQLGEVCSRDLTAVSPEDDLDRAMQLMREKALRRLLVLDSQQHAVGVVSLGDLALERDPGSVLGQISAAAPNS
jgi:CBS domain-containing protein